MWTTKVQECRLLIKSNDCLAGPNLSGLFGRTSGTTAGYTYSKANKDKAVDWSEEHLYEYLLNPKKVKSQKFRLCCFVTCITV